MFGGEEKQKRDQLLSILLFNCIRNIDYETSEKVIFFSYLIKKFILNLLNKSFPKLKQI